MIEYIIIIKEMNNLTNTKKDSGHTFRDYFKRAVNPMLVLKLLSEDSMYVYQMIQELKKRGHSDYTSSFLYPVLYRLQKQGYVSEGEKIISEDNRVRSYYKITDEGREHLSQLLTEYNEMLRSVDLILNYSEEDK